MRIQFPAAPRPAHWREIAELKTARNKAVERRIPSFLLDSPFSRMGLGIATAWGMVWGGIWSRGPVRRDGDLFIFTGMPRGTYPRGGVCVGRCYLTGSMAPPPAVLRHEKVHVRQWRRFGILMPLMYQLAGRDALTNRFEIDAGLVDGGYLPRP